MKPFVIIITTFLYFNLCSQHEPGEMQDCPPNRENNKIITKPIPFGQMPVQESDIDPRHLSVLPREGGQPSGAPLLKFVNTWEYWTKPNYPGWNEWIDLVAMNYSPSLNNTMQILNPFETLPSYDWLGWSYENNEMITPENGWELMSMNLGYYPNIYPEKIAVNWSGNEDQRKTPFLAFYNKYNSTLRVFFQNLDYENNTNAFLRARVVSNSSASNVNGMFRLADTYDQALDLKTTTYMTATACPWPGGGHNWFVGDFKIAYDPCICEHNSRISFDFEFIQTGSLNIHGVELGVTQDIMNGTNYAENDFFGSFNPIAVKQQEAGYMIYKTYISALDEAIEKHKNYLIASQAVEEHNKVVEENLKMLEFAKLVVSLGTITFGNVAKVATITASVPGLIEKSGPDKGKILEENQKAFWSLLEKNLEKSLKLLNAESFKKKDKPTKPFTALVSSSEMKFIGDLDFSSLNSGWTMNTPGSLDANYINQQRPNRYPIYNEVLGEFALLSTPVVEITHGTQERTGFEVIDDYHTSPYKDMTVNNFTAIGVNNFYSLPYQIKVNSLFDYAINKIVPINNVNVEAQLIIKYSIIDKRSNPPSKYPTSANTGGGKNHYTFKIPQNTAMNVYPELFSPTGILGKYHKPSNVHIIESPRLPIGAFENLLMQFEVESEVFHRYNNDLGLPAHYVWEPMIQGFGSPIQFFETEFEFEIRLFVEIDYDAQYNVYNYNVPPSYNSQTGSYDYNIENTTDVVINHVRTFRIPKGDVVTKQGEKTFHVTNDVSSFNFSAWNNVDHFVGIENLNFSSTHFDGSYIPGCYLSDNIYTCRSLNEINIYGHLTVEPGYQVFIESAVQIDVQSIDIYEEDAFGNPVYVETVTGVVEPEITLQINPGIIAVNNSQPYNSEQISTFCSEHYFANEASSLAPYEDDPIAEEDSSVYSEVEIVVYPNPTGSSSMVQFSLDNSTSVELFLTSISGEVLSETVSYDATSGDFRHLVNLQSFEKGIYLLVIQINGKRYVKRIVKI